MLGVEALARALRAADETQSVPGEILRGLGVHRANHIHGLVAALVVAFPVTRRIVGDAFFDALARLYIRENPPRSRILAEYGDTLGEFIAVFEPAAAVPYLADVARLEYGRISAYHAADAPSVRLNASRDLEAVLEESFVLAPATIVVRSLYPIQSIWLANQPAAKPVVEDWTPETVVIARCDGRVILHRAGPVELALVDALQWRGPLVLALEAAGAGGREGQAVEAFIRLSDACALTKLEPQSTTRDDENANS